MQWLTPGGSDRDPERVRRRLLPLFRTFVAIELAKETHLVQCSDDGVGAAIWHEVDDWKTPPAAYVKVAPHALRTFGRRLPLALRLFDMVERAHPPEPHRYLGFLGVHHDRKGQGRGSALLAAMTATCDEQGLPAYLENSNPLNTPLYARYGFVSRGPLRLPSGAPEMLAMWRDPR